ncbi:MAG TPA: DUF2059 domain-containing protein [Dongiaceae bacterium]|jgi:hypothetical protein|nr:DUF2059 domain-containing protein [Dongiaceae bacterium]
MRLVIVRVAVALSVALLACAGPARAQEVDPKALELSRKIATLTNAQATGDQVLSLIMPKLTELVVRANPGMEAQARDMMDSRVTPAMREMLPEMVELTAQIYARHFTVDELTQLTDFYGTPLGQKLIQSQPVLIAEAGQAGQQWAVKVIQKILKDLEPEFKQRGLQVPA